MDSVQMILHSTKSTEGFLKFVVPSVISMLFMALYTIVDGIFVSRYCGADALAGINIVLPLFNLAGGVGIMAAAGGSALVAIEIGACNREKANGYFSMIMGSVLVVSIFISVIAFLGFDSLIVFLGATSKIIRYSEIYGMMIIMMLPVFVMKILLEFFMRVDGKPNMSLILSLSGGIINILFDWIFMACFNMGIIGAALATAMGAIVSTSIGIWYFLTRSELKFTWIPWEMKPLMDTVVNGSSEMLTELSTGITTFMFNITALKFAGETGIAALSILLYSHFLLVSVFLGFASGVAPLISYAHGAEDFKVLDDILRRSRRYIAMASVVILLFTFFKADLLTSAFVKPESPVYGMTINALKIFAVAFLFMGINIFTSARYTALNRGGESAFVALSRSLFGTLLGLAILPSWFGLSGLWMVVPFAEALTILVVLYLLRMKKESLDM